MNLLDTPGHADFSEDTYRTLHAVDGAVMLLDCAKGVEPQTKKLFRVCKQRKMPIFTLRQQDGPARARAVRPHRRGRERARHRRLPDDLAHLPRAARFVGVYQRTTRARAPLRRRRAPARAPPSGAEMADGQGRRRSTIPSSLETIGEDGYAQLREEIELLDAAGDALRPRALPGRRGLADVLRERHQQLRPRSVPRHVLRAHAAAVAATSTTRARSTPTTSGFSGFVFKIQANMDRAHRDRVAFLRICSGRFERGMKVHARPHRPRDPPREPDAVPRPGAHHRRGGVRRRRHRRLRPGHLRDRRHAHRRGGPHLRGDPELRAGALRAPRR